MLKILFLIPFALIFVQDLRDRMISILYPILIFIAGLSWLIYDFFTYELLQPTLNFCVNLVLTAIILLSLNIYIKIRKGKHKKLAQFFGWGDILLLFCLTPLLPYKFFILSILTAVIFSLIYGFIQSKKGGAPKLAKLKIPFASWLSASCVLFFLFKSNFV